MERHEFRAEDGNKYLALNLNTSFDIVGIDEDIEKYVNFKKNSLINPTVDAEYTRFKYLGLNNKIITPLFKNTAGLYSNSIENALFTLDEVNNQQESFTNSYFIFEYFDLMNEDEQILLSTSFLKPMTKRDKTYTSTYIANSYKFATFNTIITYSNSFESWNEFNYVSIPNNYLDLKTIYLKISFFNSKLGGRTFFHSNSQQPENPLIEDFYLPLFLFKNEYIFLFPIDINLYEHKNIKLIARERANNKPNASNISSKTLILGSGDVI